MPNEEQNNEQELNDIEIAELANKELKARDAEIEKLKRDLAKAKLYQQATDEEPELMSKEECVKAISNPSISNYDYAKAVCDLVDNCKANGEANPLGEDGDEVYEFLREVIDNCGGDKSRFPSIYQSMIGADDTKVAAAYNKRFNK